jgi:hypothetical protein
MAVVPPLGSATHESIVTASVWTGSAEGSRSRQDHAKVNCGLKAGLSRTQTRRQGVSLVRFSIPL